MATGPSVAHAAFDKQAGTTVVTRVQSCAPSASTAIYEIRQQLNDQALSFVLILISPSYDRHSVVSALTEAFDEIPVFGCTTAGEIGLSGYDNNSIVALGFSEDHFRIKMRLIRPIGAYALDDGAALAADLMAPDGIGEAALWPHSFMLLLCDGLSRQEDAIVASLAPSLGEIPLVGGSAGDGLDFRETFVLAHGAFHEEAAIVAMIRTRCPVKAIRFDNFVPTDRRMVVTGAIPAERIVTEINAEPAAREYARIVGKDPNHLTPFIFAENPVVMRIGGEHFCRAIQMVEANGDLRFLCAIDEGIVLTVAKSQDIVAHIDRTLTALSTPTKPDVILGFDCVLRRLDVETTQRAADMSEVLCRHGVMGFNTYGEQYCGMHVNQTFTGAAIYPPGQDDHV
ncbi:MAG: FIST N-terminal domain-containing protein [Pseudomonadota bacterium]